MRVFVTGATGWVGSVVVKELIGAGHQVLGLARSDANATALGATGAEVLRGSLEDLDTLKRGTEATDGVIHTAFIHDFSNFKASCAVDERAIEAIGEVLAGTEKPLLVTSGVALLAHGRAATEDDNPPARNDHYPRVSEPTAMKLAARGIRASVVRLPPSVHGQGDKGFVPMLINLAREKGVSAYIGDGTNRWAGVHRLDAARGYRLALEKAATGARYHVLDEEGTALRDIAALIGRRLNIPVVAKSPEEAPSHFGWFTGFAGMDMSASSTKTRAMLGWQPTQPNLLADVDQPYYFGG